MQGKVLKQIHRFVDDALATGDCVLINSGDGNSRACCVMVGYFVAKFGWSVGKALEFVRSRRPEVSPKPLYLKQLQVSAKGLGCDTVFLHEYASSTVPLTLWWSYCTDYLGVLLFHSGWMTAMHRCWSQNLAGKIRATLKRSWLCAILYVREQYASALFHMFTHAFFPNTLEITYPGHCFAVRKHSLFTVFER